MAHFTDDTQESAYNEGYEQGREDAINFFKFLIIREDEDYDKPTISMKFLNDYIDQMLIDGFSFENIMEQLDKSDNQVECQTLRWVLDVLSDTIK